MIEMVVLSYALKFEYHKKIKMQVFTIHFSDVMINKTF